MYVPPIITGTKIPFVFILPPITGGNELDQSLALRFCSNKMGVYLLNILKDRPFIDEVYNFNTHNENLIRAHAAIRTIIEKISQNTNASGAFRILGSSLGGIQAAYIAGGEPQIKSTVILAGGGYLPGILALSDQESVVRQRDAREDFLSQLGILVPGDAAELEEIYVPYIKQDPLKVAPNIPAGSAFMFIVIQDTSVPTRYQQELRAQIKYPRVIEIDSTHVLGIVEAGTVHAQEITEFLLEKLDQAHKFN